jgi:indole-3-glycerol phosphate synthase
MERNMSINILHEIADRTKERISEQKKLVPFEDIRAQAEVVVRMKDESENGLAPSLTADGSDRAGFGFATALKAEDISFICEVKKASPSKGIIAEDFPYLEIAREYEAAGASAISCLTEPYYFLGADRYLREITETVSIPVLRKDFTVDPYMIYEAVAYGASAILLITSILTDSELLEYRQLAEELKMDALVETHDEDEIQRALVSGAKIIGVNNRNLGDFSVDTGNSSNLRKMVPDDVIFVSESGIKTPEDVARLREIGVDAILIGETLMRSTDKKKTLAELRG